MISNKLTPDEFIKAIQDCIDDRKFNKLLEATQKVSESLMINYGKPDQIYIDPKTWKCLVDVVFDPSCLKKKKKKAKR